MTGRSPLPDGCEFYLYPRYRVFFCGSRETLSRAEGQILVLLMSKPGRYFMTKEIASEIYWYRRDGGPLTATNSIAVQIFHMREKFRRARIRLLLKNPASQHGYMFRGMELIEQPARPVRERRQLVPAE